MALMNAVGKNEDDEQESKFQVHIGLGVRARSAFCNRQRSESFDDFVIKTRIAASHWYCAKQREIQEVQECDAEA